MPMHGANARWNKVTPNNHYKLFSSTDGAVSYNIMLTSSYSNVEQRSCTC